MDPQDIANWITITKGGGALGLLLMGLLTYVVNNERAKRKEHEDKVSALEDELKKFVTKDDLKEMKQDLTSAINSARDALNQRITDTRHRDE